MSFITCLILSPLPPTGLTYASRRPMRAQERLWAHTCGRRLAGAWEQAALIHLVSVAFLEKCAVCILVRSFSCKLYKTRPNQTLWSAGGAPAESARWSQTGCLSSCSSNLATVFDYKGNPSIIAIMRRKDAHKGACNALLRSPFGVRRVFWRDCVRPWGYKRSTAPGFYLDWSRSGNKNFDPSYCLADFPQAVFQRV